MSERTEDCPLRAVDWVGGDFLETVAPATFLRDSDGRWSLGLWLDAKGNGDSVVIPLGRRRVLDRLRDRANSKVAS